MVILTDLHSIILFNKSLWQPTTATFHTCDELQIKLSSSVQAFLKQRFICNWVNDLGFDPRVSAVVSSHQATSPRVSPPQSHRLKLLAAQHPYNRPISTREDW